MKSGLKSNSNASFAGFSAIRQEVDNGGELANLLVVLKFGAICQFLCADILCLDKYVFAIAIPHIYAPII